MFTSGSVGFAIDPEPGNAHLDAAAEIEDLGAEAFWINGGRLDRLDRLTDLIAATTRARVAPAIIAPDIFGPQEVARFYRRVEAATPGRLVIGLGSSQRGRPLAKLAHYVDGLDDPEDGVPKGRRLLAAFGPRKLSIARERFGGAVPMAFTPAHTALARLRLGTTSTLAIGQFVVVDADPARARATARVPLSFLMNLPGYVDSAGRQGFDRTDITELSDRLVDAFVAWGEPDRIVSRVREHLSAGANHVYLSVLHGAGQPGTRAAARELLPELQVEADSEQPLFTDLQ